jgi:outer membrane protein TolC
MIRLRFLVGWLAPLALLAAEPASAATPLSDDPALQALIRDALAKNPDLARARLVLDAERERVPQAGALPDPTVSFGWQNAGLLPGQDAMGLTYATLMASQPLPYPGKRAARQRVAAAAAVAGQQGLERLRLRLRAGVERGYVGLLLLRAQGRLQRDQLTLWRQAVDRAKARAAVGQGSQADVLRAQLELARLEQGRVRLASEATLRVLALTRLAGRPADQAIDSGLALDEVPLPTVASDVVAGNDSASPELAAARAGVTLADLQADVARLDRQPDFAVQAGVMPKLAGWPMWQVGVSVSLPAWSAKKQDKALTEAQFRAEAGRRAQDDVRQLLAWRTRERQERLRLALEQTDWRDR